jgi:SAM-dependent methyltransferase
MLDKAEQFLAAMPIYPSKRYQGRGVVLAGGGARFFPGLYVTIRALRHFGCRLPVEVWYFGHKGEMTAKSKAILTPYQVDCVDADKVRGTDLARRMGGWELKVFATLHSRFEEVLFLDADCYPCRNPEFLFQLEDYRVRGAIFWPDVMAVDTRLKWPAFGVSGPRYAGSVESGQFLLNKCLSWQALNLAWFYNDHSDYYYRYCFGDKHTFEVAWARCDQPFVMWEAKARWTEVAYLHPGPDSLPLFVHRCADKFRFEIQDYNTPQHHPLPSFYSSLPLERECWGWMAELARLTGRVLSRQATGGIGRAASGRRKPPRFVIATLHTPEMAELGQCTSPVMIAYAERHGYDTVVASAGIDASRPVTWSRLLLVERCLVEHPRCEWVVWMDADAVINDPVQRLESFVDDNVDFLVAHGRPPSLINLGVFFIRNCPASIDMLRRAYAKVQYIHHPHKDQHAVTDALRDCADTLRIRMVPRRLFNSFADEHQQDDFIVHFAGSSQKAKLAAVRGLLAGKSKPPSRVSAPGIQRVLPWTPATVSNAQAPETAAIRNYWEHRLVREAAALASKRHPVNVAYELGAGYGRVARVLAEFAGRVVAFERDPKLLAVGRALNPDVEFVDVQKLGDIPAKDDSADFMLTFTVLQHLTDATYYTVLHELKRLIKRGGHVLLVEETDASQADCDLPHDETGCVRYRSVARYQADAAPLRLVRTWRRRVEIAMPRVDVGTAMLFAAT